MDKNIGVEKLDIDSSSKVSGGNVLPSVYGGHKPRFKHPMNVDPEWILIRRKKSSGEEHAHPKPVLGE
ncbi:MAG: hypothetical protein IKE41_00910 [Clostridia bacterium]|nr:hypothetical protein [Clostridia bacterium]MBR2734651.1 hypothetical protein [Clostridia bacterium]